MVNDGLASGQVKTDTLTILTSSSNVNSSVTGSSVADNFVGSDATFKDDVSVTDALTIGGNIINNTGSPFSTGYAVQLTARTNISGGTFVSASGNLAYAAPADTLYPIGVSVPGTDVASGGTVNVITHGVVPVIAEGAVAIGEGVIMGGGAALNTVLPSDTSSGLRVFGVLDAAGSEGVVFITL
jgi:hypothetical protein